MIVLIDYMIVDIVLLPPKAVSEKIGRFVRELSELFKLEMAVDNKELLPHISLLHIKTMKKNIGMIAGIAKQISQKHSELDLQFTKPKIGKDYFVFDLDKTEKLMDLHREAVLSIHKFKTGFSGVGNPKGRTLERQYIKKYGAGNILQNFQPHITLGIVKNPQDLPRIRPMLSKLRLEKFKANRLAVARVNSRHQVYKVIRELKLKIK